MNPNSRSDDQRTFQSGVSVQLAPPDRGCTPAAVAGTSSAVTVATMNARRTAPPLAYERRRRYSYSACVASTRRGQFPGPTGYPATPPLGSKASDGARAPRDSRPFVGFLDHPLTHPRPEHRACNRATAGERQSACRGASNPRLLIEGPFIGYPSGVSTRIAAICGLLAPLTYSAALLFGGLVQRDGFSSADHSTSALGADTASSPWIYNQIATNLTGLLIFMFALGLWQSLSPDLLGRVGAGLLALQGVGLFLEGFFPLDCQPIDAGCENTSWQSEGHRWVSRVTAVFLFAAPLVLAFAFRRNPRWRDAWLPTLAAIPVFFAASIVFSAFGSGAATRGGAVAWFVWLGFVAFQLLRKSEPSPDRSAA